MSRCTGIGEGIAAGEATEATEAIGTGEAIGAGEAIAVIPVSIGDLRTV